MWPGWIKELRDFVAAVLAGGGASVNVTLVGGAVGGQTVAQGDPNAGAPGTPWPVVETSAAAVLAALAGGGPLGQPQASAAVTPSDSTALTATKGLWVGTAGDLAVKLAGDSSATVWKNVPSGTYVPGHFIRVMAATTAADIVALS